MCDHGEVIMDVCIQIIIVTKIALVHLKAFHRTLLKQYVRALSTGPL